MPSAMKNSQIYNGTALNAEDGALPLDRDLDKGVLARQLVGRLFCLPPAWP